LNRFKRIPENDPHIRHDTNPSGERGIETLGEGEGEGVRANPSGEKGIETLGDGGGRKDRVRTREMEAIGSLGSAMIRKPPIPPSTNGDESFALAMEDNREWLRVHA
jgi:hypothetical protein